MVPSSILTYLHTAITCSTIFSSGNFMLANQNVSQATAKEPWNLFDKLTPVPDNCATLILDSPKDYFDSLTALSRTRIKVDVIVLSDLNSNASQVLKNLEMEQSNYVVTVVQYDYENITGITHISPYDTAGKAVRRHVTVAYTLIRPHVTTAGEHPTGSDIDILLILSKSLGFSVNFINAKSFSGIVEAVSSGRADMSISQAALALHRYRLGTDMLAVITKRYMLVQRHPVPINSIYTITQPLTYQVWLAILATVLSVAIFLACLNRWYTGAGGLSYQDFCISYIPLVSESVPHAWYRNNYRTPYYITLYIWLLLGTFLSMAYETNLLANLVKVELESQPQTLQDVLDMRFGLYVLQNSILTTFLKDSPMDIHRKIYAENVLVYGGFYSGAVVPPPNIIEKILGGNYLAFLTDDGLPSYQHLFSVVREEVNSGPAGYYFQINLPIKDEIIDGLMLFRDIGILQKITERTNWKLLRPWRNLKRNQLSSQPVIGISHLSPLFVIWMIGFGLMVISFTMEIRTCKYLWRKLRKLSNAKRYLSEHLSIFKLDRLRSTSVDTVESICELY